MTTRTQRWLWRIGAAVMAAAAVTATIGPSGFLLGSVTGSAATTRHASCLPGQEVPIMDSPHVSAAETAATRYNSTPPTSGPHFAFTVATGVYSDPVAEGLTVHAMEHGHIVIQYAPGTPRETVHRLTRLAKRYGKDVVLAPYPAINHGIALTAWGRIELMEQYNEHQATVFIERLRNRYVHGWTRADDCAPSSGSGSVPHGAH